MRRGPENVHRPRTESRGTPHLPGGFALPRAASDRARAGVGQEFFHLIRLLTVAFCLGFAAICL